MKELAQLIDKHATELGVQDSVIPRLRFSKRIHPEGPLYGVQRLAFCIVVQGRKKVNVADETVYYGPGDYFISTVNVPTTGFIEEATPDAPFLGMMLELTPQEILKVMQESHLPRQDKGGDVARGMYVDRLTGVLEDVATRLVRLLETPEDIDMMRPMIVREIIYRVLQEDQGHVLAAVAREGSSANKVSAAIKYMMEHFTESVKVDDLAQVVNMSSSTFHRYFKEVTAMSPLQFQKQLRLQKARELLFDSEQVTEVAYQVGYESSSQFSREYSRMFGASPREDVKQFRAGFVQ